MDVVVKLPDKEGHLYVLDDPDNPLVLAAGSTDRGGHQQIIKIYWDRRAAVERTRAGPGEDWTGEGLRSVLRFRQRHPAPNRTRF